MSPLKIGLCLHYHSAVADDPWIESGALIVDETMDELVADGLLAFAPTLPPFDVKFVPTPKLHAFVALLEATPLPKQEWFDPRNDTIIKGGLR